MQIQPQYKYKYKCSLVWISLGVAVKHSHDPEIRQAMEPQMDEVYPNVFIGNYKGAKTFDLLKGNNIKHIFNVAEGTETCSCGVFDSQPYLEAGISYQGMVIRDDVDQDDEGQQQKLFREAANVIDNCIKGKDHENILVFCFGGLSRSTSSVLSYLVLKKKMDLKEALKQVKSKRDVHPSAQQLVHLAKMYNVENNLSSPKEDLFEKEPLRNFVNKE